MTSSIRKRTSNKSSNSGQSSVRTNRRQSKAKTNNPIISGIKSILKWTFILLLFVLIIVFIISPVVFRYSLTVRRLLVFMNYMNYPLFKDLTDPKNTFDMNCTQNLYLTNEDIEDNQSIRLGVWHILPESRTDDCLRHNHSMAPELAFDDNRPIFLYLHGNGGARGGFHRRQLYKVLSNASLLDAHVIAFDYRGYGDSTNVWPTSAGLTRDSDAVYQWLLTQKHVNKNRVIVWGHSLGTAVAINLVSHLAEADNPRAVVLEAPFTSIGEAIQWHPFAIIYRKYFPFFDTFFVDPVVDNNVTNFDSISLVNRIGIPLLILHSQDDGIVPFHLGRKLYERSLSDQPKNVRNAQMIAFNGQYGYGHKYICKDQEFPQIIQNFIKSIE